jgi:hypothetical protein
MASAPSANSSNSRLARSSSRESITLDYGASASPVTLSSTPPFWILFFTHPALCLVIYVLSACEVVGSLPRGRNGK